ncbi:MAG: tRNA pseudouridine(13) synthase TruD [Halioglobus sp.]
MTPTWPRAWGDPSGSTLIRSCPEDFQVNEELGFALSGEGEHCFLYLQKRKLNSMELVHRVSALSAIPPRDIGLSGLKDRNAVTRQWISIGMAGREEPDWTSLESDGDITIVEKGRHLRKLRRGVHRANRFSLVLRELDAEPAELEQRLRNLREFGVPNYFGEQRFGRGGSTLEQARRWMKGGRRISREKRSLYYSALRALVFNELLALRVQSDDWNSVLPGDVCMLHGSRSFFTCDDVTDDIRQRTRTGDIHPGLPLWGHGLTQWLSSCDGRYAQVVVECQDVCDFLESSGLDCAWRPARLLPDDFCWQFCDDATLRLDFSLGAGGYATALLAELVRYKEGSRESGFSG